MINEELSAAVDAFLQLTRQSRLVIGVARPFRNRLEVLLSLMFQQFLNPRGARALGFSPDLIPPLQDNLDTGNAHHEPHPEFTLSLLREISAADAARRYHGPEAIEELVISARDFAVKYELVTAESAKSLGVLAGIGTVNLYDSVCRIVIVRQGDGIIVPTPTYGFFLSQIERAGGEVIPLPIRDGGWVRPAEVQELIERSNAHRWWTWRTELRARLEIAMLRWPSIVNWDALATNLQAVQTRHDADSLLAEVFLLLGNQVLNVLSPPRVVGFLQINPNVNGLSMNKTDVSAIAKVLADQQVVAIEDLAYHSMRLSQGDHSVVSFLSGPAAAYTLVGFSKPFSLAAHRVGVLLTRQPIGPLERMVESTVGFVSPASQKAMATVLGASKKSLGSYHENARTNPAEGYNFKRDVLVTLLVGESAEMSGVNHAKAAARIKLELKVLAPALDVEQQSIENFMKWGLSELLRIECVPQVGIFVLVSCHPFLQLKWAQALGLTSSFDFFAWAAFFTGVRSIPEEAMGALDACHVLRLSFSPTSFDPRERRISSLASIGTI